MRSRQPLLAAWTRCLLIATSILSGCGHPSPSTPFVPSATPTPAPGPATLADLSAAVTSPQAGLLLNCRDDVVARVTLTNRSGSAVLVSGVRRTTRVLDGGCLATPDFVFLYGGFARPNDTTVLLNSALYTGGSGCCSQDSRCDGRGTCGFEQSLTVLAMPGEIPAGTFSYRVNYLDCVTCSQPTGAARGRCAPAIR